MQVYYYKLNENIVNLKFVVILTKYKEKWVFVRHKDRSTWEFPGGHIEPGECIDDAAKRELGEESGADQFIIEPVCNYGVNQDGNLSYGRVYFSEIKSFNEHLEFEIDEVLITNHIPENLTYPIIMKSIIEKVLSMEETNE